MYCLGFVDGTCSHFIDLARGGIHVYASFAPVPLQVFFVGLAVLDPLVVAMVALARWEGVWLACGVMVLDMIGNWITNWPRLRADPAWLLRPVGLTPIMLFGLFVLATAVPVLRAMGAGGSVPGAASSPH